MNRARVLAVGALPFGLLLTVATTSPHLHTDVFVFVVISYLGVSALSLHGLLQLEEQATKQLRPEDRRPRDRPEPWADVLMPTDARLLQFAPRSGRSRQHRGSGVSGP